MGVKKAVFVVTDVGKVVTRVEVPVSVDCTAAQFKKEFESVHFKIHPEHGKLRVETLEVKLGSFFYALPDLLPVRLVLDGEEQCLHVRASESERQGSIDASLEPQGADIEEHLNSGPKSNYIVPDTPPYRQDDVINGGTMVSSRRLMFD